MIRKHILAAALALLPGIALAQQRGQVPINPVVQGLTGTKSDTNALRWGDYTTPIYNSAWDNATVKIVRAYTATGPQVQVFSSFLDVNIPSPTQSVEGFA